MTPSSNAPGLAPSRSPRASAGTSLVGSVRGSAPGNLSEVREVWLSIRDQDGRE